MVTRKPLVSPVLLSWSAVSIGAVAGFCWALPLYFLADDFGYVWRFSEMPVAHWPRLFFHEWSEGLWGIPLRELRPIAALSFLIDTRLWGAHPAGYHLTSLLAHVVCSLTVMLIAFEVLRRGWLPAAASGILFALHPVHTEAVTWISGRADLLGTLGFLLGFYGLLRFRSSSGQGWLALAWLAYFAGIFSKESCLLLPLVCLLYDALFTRSARRSFTKVALPYAGWAIVALAYLWVRTQAFGPDLGTPPLVWWTKDFWRIVAQREMVYLGELFWPIASWLPTADNQRRLALQVLLRIVGGIVVAAGVIWWTDRRKNSQEARATIFFLLGWYLLTTLPFVVTYVSARHLYLASAGVCLGIISMLTRTARRPVAFSAITCLLIAACAAQLYVKSTAWRQASHRSAQITQALRDIDNRAAPGDVLVLNVPATANGAWLWAWSSPYALRPPFHHRDLGARFIVWEHAGAYFHPEGYIAHPSLARLRAHTGGAWLLNVGDRVESIAFTSRQYRDALMAVDIELGAPGSFERLVAALHTQRTAS